MLVLSGLLLVSAAGVGALIGLKLAQGSVKGSQSLGLALLAAVGSQAAAAVPFIIPPSEAACRAQLAAHPAASAAAFALLLAKAVQLRNAETLLGSGGGSIGFWNYWLLVIFAVGLQVPFRSPLF